MLAVSTILYHRLRINLVGTEAGYRDQGHSEVAQSTIMETNNKMIDPCAVASPIILWKTIEV